MNSNVIRLPNLSVDVSAVESVFGPDGYEQWTGKVVLTFDDGPVVTANWAGRELKCEGTLCDFEGEPEPNDPIYKRCEDNADVWSTAIATHLGYPSMFDAHRKARAYTLSLIGK